MTRVKFKTYPRNVIRRPRKHRDYIMDELTHFARPLFKGKLRFKEESISLSDDRWTNLDTCKIPTTDLRRPRR